MRVLFSQLKEGSYFYRIFHDKKVDVSTVWIKQFGKDSIGEYQAIAAHNPNMHIIIADNVEVMDAKL